MLSEVWRRQRARGQLLGTDLRTTSLPAVTRPPCPSPASRRLGSGSSVSLFSLQEEACCVSVMGREVVFEEGPRSFLEGELKRRNPRQGAWIHGTRHVAALRLFLFFGNYSQVSLRRKRFWWPRTSTGWWHSSANSWGLAWS